MSNSFFIFSHFFSHYTGPESLSTETTMWQSTTPPAKPMTNDKIYYFLPFWDDKPCLYVRTVFQDHRRRLYNANVIDGIATKLVRGRERS